jgi:putative molybdopterin biosynthesis protein
LEEESISQSEGKDRNASAALYGAMLARWGAEGVVYRDEAAMLGAPQPVLLRAAQECDLVLLCVDTKRRSPADTLGSVGEVCVCALAIYPGGDTALGAIGSVPVVCMADEPASGIVVLEELVKPVLDRLLMRERTIAESVCVKMGIDYASAPDVRAFVRAKLGFDPEGSLSVVPIPAENNTAEHLDKADCILDVPLHCAGYAAGERAHVRLLKPIDRIARTIRIRGDHDPMLDEAADELRRSDIRAYVDSESVDAMRALEALQRGECHLCGVYLPDDADGIAWIAQHVPDGGVALMEGVRRLDEKENPPAERAYDLVVSLAAMENPQVRAFLRVLGSEAFPRRLDARGGYRYDKPGRIKKIWP